MSLLQLCLLLVYYFLLPINSHFLPKRADITGNDDDFEKAVYHYLSAYLNPGSDDTDAIESTSEAQPALTPDAPEAYDDLYSMLSDVPTAEVLPSAKTIALSMTVFSLESTEQEQLILHDNNNAEYDYAVLASTHGNWVFMLNTFYGQLIINSFRVTARAANKNINADNLGRSEIYRNEIKGPVVDGAGTNTLAKYLQELEARKGKLTNWHCYGRASQRHPANSMIFVALLNNIYILCRGRNLIPASGIKKGRTPWSLQKEPYKDAAARRLITSFFYSKAKESWVSLSLYGEELGYLTESPSLLTESPSLKADGC